MGRRGPVLRPDTDRRLGEHQVRRHGAADAPGHPRREGRPPRQRQRGPPKAASTKDTTGLKWPDNGPNIKMMGTARPRSPPRSPVAGVPRCRGTEIWAAMPEPITTAARKALSSSSASAAATTPRRSPEGPDAVSHAPGGGRLDGLDDRRVHAVGDSVSRRYLDTSEPGVRQLLTVPGEGQRPGDAPGAIPALRAFTWAEVVFGDHIGDAEPAAARGKSRRTPRPCPPTG